MALTVEQRRAVEDAWNRGIRDKGSLFAAAGIALPGAPSPAIQPGAMTPPDPDAGQGFIEQGGLLGLAGRTPGTQQLLQGLGWLGENILSPTSTAAVVGVQSLIPGEQMREKAFKEGFSKATEQGEDPFSAFVGGLRAGAHEQFEDPITTGIGIDLPGSGISIPSWIAGEGKRLDEIDIGQLAAELPAEILGAKGLGMATRPARWAAASKLAAGRTRDAATGAEKVTRISGIAPFLIKPPRTNLSRKYRRDMKERRDEILAEEAAPRSPLQPPAPGAYRTSAEPDVRAVIPSNIKVGRRPGRGEEEFFYEPAGRPLARTEPLPVAGLDQIAPKEAAIRTPSGKPIRSVEVSSDVLSSKGTRPIVFVDMIDTDGIKIRQGFYNSTGHNSGVANEWLPFFGQNVPDNPFFVQGMWRPDFQGWFIKPEPISGVVDNPRFLNHITEQMNARNEFINASALNERKLRYASEELYLISKALSQRFPDIVRDPIGNATGADSGIISSISELNDFIFRGVLPDSIADRARPLIRPAGAQWEYSTPAGVTVGRRPPWADTASDSPIQEVGGTPRIVPIDRDFDLDIPRTAEDLPILARFDPKSSPYYDPAQQRIPKELIELEEIRLRNLNAPVDEESIAKITSRRVRTQARRQTGLTTKAIASVTPVFVREAAAINFTKISKALAARDKAAKALSRDEEAFNAKSAVIEADIAKAEEALGVIGKQREELLMTNRRPDLRNPGETIAILEVSAEWDGIKKRWLDGETGKPNPASIVALASEGTASAGARSALISLARKELVQENLRVRHGSALTIHQGKSVLNSNKQKSRRELDAKTAALLPTLEDAKKILEKDYAGTEGKITGADLVVLSRLTPFKKRIFERVLRQGELEEARRPEFDLGEVSPEVIKQRIAQETADQIRNIENNNALRRALAGQIAADNASLLAVLQASTRRLFDNPIEARRNSDGIEVRSVHENPSGDIGSPGSTPPIPGMGDSGGANPPRGSMAGSSDITPDPKLRYISEDAFSVKESSDGYLRTSANQRIPLAEFVTRTKGDASAWWLSKWTAEFLNSTIGSVNRWIVNNSRAHAIMFSYEAKLANRIHIAHRDVTNFLQKKYVGVGNSKLDQAYKFYPVDRESGLWGKTDLYANDVAEAYWLHRWLGDNRFHAEVDKFTRESGKTDGYDLLDNVSDGGGFGKKFSKFFMANGTYMTREQRQAAWDKFFRETTEPGIGTRAGEFLDDLGDFFDELEVLLDPELANRIGRNADGSRRMRRQVTRFKSGERAFSTSSFHAPRFYEHMQEARAAGVVYDFNLIGQMVHHHTYASKVRVDRELRELVLDEKDGFALAYEGLGSRVASLTRHDDFEKLDDVTKSYIKQTRDTLAVIRKVEKNLNDGLDTVVSQELLRKMGFPDSDILNGDGNLKIKSINQEVIHAAYTGLSTKIIDDVATRRKVLQVPSNMFWANNLEGKMSLAALRNIYGIGAKGIGVTKSTPGVPSSSVDANNILRRIGIEDAAIVSERELRNLEEAFRGIAHLQGTHTALPVAGWTSTKFQEVVDFWRLASTGFDAAYSMTLGFPLMFKDPRAWTRMTAANIQALYDPNVMAKMIERDPALKADLDFLIDMRIGLGDQEVYKFLESGGRINKNSYYDLLRADKDPGGLNLKRRVARLATIPQRSYNTGTLLTRVYWMRALRQQFSYMEDGVEKIDTLGLKSQIERITGGINQTDLGVTIGRKRTENFWVGLSPRLTRSIASVVVDAQRGLFEIVRTRDANLLRFALSQGKSGKSPLRVAQEAAEQAGRVLSPEEIFAAREITKQALSLGNLSTLLAATSITFYMTSYGMAIMNGKSSAEAHQIATDSMDPLQGKKFMSIQIGGTWYGVGGFFRSLTILNAKMLNAGYEAVRGNFKPFNDFRSSDQFDNPIIMTMRNRGAPAVNFSGSLIEGVTASFGSPIDAAPFDVIDNTWQGIGKSAESFLPFAFQGLVDGDGLTSLWGLTGARTSEQTLSDGSVHIARKAMGLDVSSTRDMPESWLKTDVLYPLVEQQYGLMARASNSALGQFMRRRGDLRSEFETKIAREWAAGNKNYEMIAYYFDERNLMNAKLEEFKRSVGMDDMETRKRDPIAHALKEWRDIWESKEVVEAVKDERWDIIEEKREALIKNFTPEQQAAVLRSGSGIHREILALMKPESQKRYLDLFGRRRDWIIDITKNPDYAKTLVLYLTDEMFPSIGVPRGITAESIGTQTRTPGRTYGSGVTLSPTGISDMAISPTREQVPL